MSRHREVERAAAIPFNRASFDGSELDYLGDAISAGHVSGGGRFTERAEQILAGIHDGSRTLLTTSCTHALEMSALLADLAPGDEVVVPSYTFPSSAGAFALHGARPVFVDVDPVTLNIDPQRVAEALSERTKVICAVNYAGVGAELVELRTLADQAGAMLVEDNAHGLGGSAPGGTLGTFGSLSTLSFHETKNITCGEGGALVITDPSLVERAEILRDKGTDRSKFLRGQVDKYTWVDAGSSWSQSELLAAVLCGQLERFDTIQARRQAIWDRYADELGDWAAAASVRLPVIPEGHVHTAHLFHLRFPTAAGRDRAISTLGGHGVSAVFHYQSLHSSTMGRSVGRTVGPMDVTDDAAATLLRLPLYVGMSDDDVSRVIDALTGAQHSTPADESARALR